jgi:hypothetical protein
VDFDEDEAESERRRHAREREQEIDFAREEGERSGVRKGREQGAAFAIENAGPGFGCGCVFGFLLAFLLIALGVCPAKP